MNFITKFVNEVLSGGKTEQENSFKKVENNFRKEKKLLNGSFNKEGKNFPEKNSLKKGICKNSADNEGLMVKISKDINESSERNKKSNYDKKDVDLKNNDLAKELMGYLDNDPNLDASLMKMNLQANLDHNLSSQKQSGKIEFKSSDEKSWKIIAFQFFAGVILLAISFYYIKDNVAEKKFFQSSIDLWSNIFQNVISQLGGFIKEDVDKSYIEKRGEMINKLVMLEKDIQVCIDNTNNDEKLKELKQLLQKVNSYKEELGDIHLVPLEKFIKKYDEYALRLYSLQESKQKICKND